MKILPFLAVIFLSTPSQAITWKEFWEPFTYENRGYRYRNVECFESVYREEYVPGNRWSRGYVRSWTERVRIPCYY